ncbi:MAG: LysM peptidoglycan-binding domain-containing protein [Chloroflexi bacterium]|nr:LysM peptidoglycan-binding domain-containing protein [Chloroflexota bacterium]
MSQKLCLCLYLPGLPSIAGRRRFSRLIACLAAAVVVALPPAQAVAQSHVSQGAVTVAPGDTLSQIADRLGISTEALVRANGLASADFIKVGQRLVIAVEGAQQANTQNPAAAPSPSGGQVYTVQPGDNLISIAGRYGVSVDSIVTLNGLVNPDRISAGQTLTIPSGASDAADANRSAAMGGSDSDRTIIQLPVPYRTQFSGSPYEESDCGPATLGMLFGAYGVGLRTSSLRQWVMESTGYWGYDGGSDWKSMVYAARKAGFQVDGLYGPSGGYRKWSQDDIVSQLRAGNPPVLLVRYRGLPGHAGSSWWGDHYIVIIGLTAGGQFIYHDSAFKGGSEGAYRVISRDGLQRAWSSTSVGIAYSAMIVKK